MEAILNLSYNQILNLVEQLPPRSKLKLGRTLTQQATKAELEHFLKVFRTDEITEEDILSEVKQVRKQRHERRQKETGNR